MNILTRKNLKALNVPDEAIDAIVEAHSDAINDIKAERDKYAEQAKQIAALTTERDTLKQQLDISIHAPCTGSDRMPRAKPRWNC